MKDINCIIFEKDNSRSSGVIRLHQDSVEVIQPQGSLKIHNSLAHFEVGGSNSQYIFLKSENINLYFEAKQLRGHDHANEKIKSIYREFKSSSVRSVIFTFFIILSIFGIVFGVYNSKGVVVDFLVEKIPYKIEKDIGAKLFSLQKVGLKIIENKEAIDILEEKIKALRANLPPEYQSFDIYISNDLTMNAFAFPGGNIVLNSGLILKSDSFSEVLGVLAHEISHVTRRHVIQGLIYNISLFSIVNLLIGDISGIIAVALENGGSVLSLKFSKEMELQADRDGLSLLNKAKIDPRGLIRFLKKVKIEEEKILEQVSLDGDLVKKISPFFSTHPATEDRINYLKSNINKQQKMEDNKLEFSEFKELIRSSM